MVIQVVIAVVIVIGIVIVVLYRVLSQNYHLSYGPLLLFYVTCFLFLTNAPLVSLF